MKDFEKLGAFYLGRTYDDAKDAIEEDLLLYDAKDLTTHGICVGMTGSGKTGLCVSLLEEAAIDGIPTIAIDPKGDLGNLLLAFPELRAEDFRPWIDEAEATRKGQTPDEYAASRADLWRNGLSDWGQDPSRIARYREAADVAIYTPGSRGGRPINVLGSLAAPPAAVLTDEDALQNRVQNAVSGLLTLVGLDGDPLQSRDHILLSTIIDRIWRDGRDLELGALIQEIQSPPIDRIGVLDLESFYPSKDRFKLSVMLNNILAAPSFGAWAEGEPLDIGRLLYTQDGRPRISVLSIAHLNETERMFFVTMVLNEVLSWIRSQPGTSSLRALLYMDEIFGFFPPSAMPPSKRPMLALLKQARAYGLGVLLATQNPVDLDYKGLGNTGTWFIGRLQTERDVDRLMNGLSSASSSGGAAVDERKLKELVSGLKSRVFLLHNVHENGPQLFHSRWALSYLSGPLTLNQIKALNKTLPPTPTLAPTQKKPEPVAAMPETEEKLVIPPGITEWYLRPNSPVPADHRVLYRPALRGNVRLHFVRATYDVDVWQSLEVIMPLDSENTAIEWEEADVLLGKNLVVASSPEGGAQFDPLPSDAVDVKRYSKWSKSLASHLYQNRRIDLLKCAQPKAISLVGEDEGAFRGRLTHLIHEKRDAELDKLRKKYEKKFATLRDRIQRAEDRVEIEEEQLNSHRAQSAISFGSALLGAFLGRKVMSRTNVNKMATTAGRMSRGSSKREDVKRAEEKLESYRQKLAEMELTFEEEIEDINTEISIEEAELTSVDIKPRKADISVDAFGLLWLPWYVDSRGIAEPAYDFESGN